MAELNEKDVQHLFAMNKFIKWYEETFNKTVDFTIGKKYTRVFTTYNEDGKPKTVVCFVDIDGNIYKPAGWKTPTKHIRGNINNNPEQAFYSNGCI